MVKSVFLLFFFLNVTYLAYSQNKFTLNFHPKNKEFSFSKPIDSSSASLLVRDYLSFLHAQGYLFADVDSVYWRTDKADVFIHVGDQFKWLALYQGNVADFLLSKIGFRERFYRNKVFNYPDIARLEEKLIAYAERSGYPFASVHLDSICLRNSVVLAALNYDPGPIIYFDSIQLVGDSKVKTKFMQRYLGIIPGQLFDQKKIEQIPDLLMKLPYVEEEQPLSIIYRGNKAKLVLFLKSKKVNNIDGVVGLLPSQGQSKKVLFTGEANLLLQNLFGSGKRVLLEWKKYNMASQLLNFSYYHPAMLGTSLDVTANFNLLKQDSSYLNLDKGVKIAQRVSGKGVIGLLANYKTSRDLGGNSTLIITDFNYFQYGLEYTFENLDNFFFPRRGWNLSFFGGLGNKTVKNAIAIEDSPGKDAHSVQYSSQLKLERYSPVSKATTLLSRLSAGTVLNNHKLLYASDLYRIGGLATLRGFNEKNFYTRDYLVTTVEYRIFLDKATYFMIFTDQAYLYHLEAERKVQDFPTGIGAGVSFSAGSGIFSFVYSLGRSANQNFAFNLSKIHFGFIAHF